MGIVSDFLKRKSIDDQAEKLASLFLQHLPLHRVHDEKKFATEFNTVFGHIQGYQRKENLGVYGEARLVNTFQWALVKYGYDKQQALDIGQQISTNLMAKQTHPTT